MIVIARSSGSSVVVIFFTGMPLSATTSTPSDYPALTAFLLLTRIIIVGGQRCSLCWTKSTPAHSPRCA